MANEEEKAELQSKLTMLLAKRFGGAGDDAWSRAFEAYDTDRNGQISMAELERLLEDADIGNFLTRRAWAGGVMDALDKDASSTISKLELLSALSKAKHTSTLITSTPAVPSSPAPGTSWTTAPPPPPSTTQSYEPPPGSSWTTAPGVPSSSTKKGDNTPLLLAGLALAALWVLRK